MKYKFDLSTFDFKELKESESFFVDKSLFIKEVIEENSKIVLIPRPRRFGKSLNFSMLKYFFDIKEESRELFKGLKISKEKECMEHMNKYPVLSITFKDVFGDSWPEVEGEINLRISEIYSKYKKEVWEVLTEEEKKVYKQLESKTAERREVKNSIKKLTEILHRKYGKKVILLIDEYDAVMTSMYGKEGFDSCMGIFRGIYEKALKGNDAIHKALMTGITRVAKEGIFSGLNNIKVYGVTHNKYGEYFGFTEEEVKPIIKNSELNYEEAKEWYNGYNFGGHLLYNPWSVVNYVTDRKAESYWKNTSGNDLVKELVKKGGPEVKYSFERMLEGESVNLEVEDNVNLRELEVGDIYSLLLQSGYLTYEEKDGVRKYKLPNKEVRDFISYLIQEINKELKLPESIEKAFIRRDWEKLKRLLHSSMSKILSYFDVPKRRETESMYHMMLLGMFSSFKMYEVKSNVETGHGRVDILMRREDKKENIVIEIKAGDKFDKLEDLLEEAKDQIKDEKYGEDLKGEVIKIGIGFIGKTMKLEVVD